jgi:hypothetical protein
MSKVMNLKIKIFIFCSIGLVISAYCSDFEVDYKAAGNLWNTHPSVANPTRVDLYVEGPKRGVGSKYLGFSLPSGIPVLSVTNHDDIDNLMIAIRNCDNRFHIENMHQLEGYTYNLFLFQETNKTVIQVRVFEPLDLKKTSCAILPRDDGVGAVYYSEQIGPWLHAQLKNTNAALNKVVKPF